MKHCEAFLFHEVTSVLPYYKCYMSFASVGAKAFTLLNFIQRLDYGT